MNDYIDLVVVKHPFSEKKYLFRAPELSHLQAGDAVFVETNNGIQIASVVEVYDWINADDAKLFGLLKDVSNVKYPLKRVVSKLVEMKFDYKEEESTDGHDSDN